MYTTIITPVACDEHEVTSVTSEITPGEWAVVALYCWDCDVTYEAFDITISE